MITIERKKFIVSAWANWSAFRFGAEWNFIKEYWTITFMFGFWSLDVSKAISCEECDKLHDKVFSKKDTK